MKRKYTAKKKMKRKYKTIKMKSKYKTKKKMKEYKRRRKKLILYNFLPRADPERK